jgi:phosphoribosylaminoimidazole-succinocarboxamide synthase
MTHLKKEAVVDALAHPLEGTDFPELGEKYTGKVRDNYTKNGERTIIVSDRISAFDRVLGTLPLKGQLLNHVAAWWFEKTRGLADNHVIRTPDPNAMVVHECEPLPVEMVMRAYLTGTTSTSIWVHYQNGARTFCGHALPDGMKKHQRLAEPILTPSTKAAQGDHDVSASREEILEITGMPTEDFDRAAKMATELFAFGQKVCAERGILLVDTKYEFGKTTDGRIVIIDEIHTPDSSRFWFSSTYDERFNAGADPESFDKEYVRRWLADRGFRGEGEIPNIPDEVKVEAILRYAQAVETLTGEAFVPNLEDPLPRLRKNLGLS